MRHERITIRRDNNTVHSTTVPPWEVSILEYLFGEGNVESTGEFVETGREYPDPRDEMARLQKAYGADVKTDTPHAITVYGQGRNGVRALAKVIEAAQEDSENAAKPKSSRRRAVDPLMV